ncbi:MAG: 2-oxo acid dehydrogenase subunit E2 [Bacteroidota bacterium]
MAIEVKIPKISEEADTAKVAEILVKEGDTIEKDQSVIAVETDKASVEVPSSHSGTVKEIKMSEGDEVKVGDVILTLEEGEEKEEKEEGKGKEQKKDEPEKEEGKVKEEKEKVESEEAKEEEKKKKEEKKEEKEVKEEEEESEEKKQKKEGPEDKETEGREEKEKEETEKEQKDSGTSGKPASPSVRRLARELGVKIEEVEGSGPGGRISEDDVKSHTKEEKEKTTDGQKLSLPDFSKWGSTETKPLSGIRMETARRTKASWQNIPHVFQFDEADISEIEKYMEKNKEKAEEAGGKLTITAILLKVSASALQQFPKFNASIDPEKEEMILKHYIHIGIAVDTEKGLLLPVIRDVDKKSIIELAAEITKVAEKAREGKLSPDEMKGGNFSISNLGGIGGTNFTPIIYHPQVAILGVSRAKTSPVFSEGEFKPREVLPLSLSYDHRLIDGAEGAEFLHWIVQALEDPYKALLGA